MVAGSPTEQDITITVLINLAINQNFKIEILLVAMRSFETKSNFDTPKELEKIATKIYEKKICRIKEDLATSEEFKKRIVDFVKVINQNI